MSLWLLGVQPLLAVVTNTTASKVVPPSEVRVEGAVRGDVTNTAELEDIPALRPPHAEIPPSFQERYGLWVILAGIALLALVGAAVWLMLRPRPPEAVPPDVAARRALEPLSQQPEDGLLLSRVSHILRHYVAAAFNLPAGELTTAEFCRAVAGNGQVGPELSAALGEFLRQCDQRKFSPPPAPAAPFDAVLEALKLIDQAQIRRIATARATAPPNPNLAATPSATGAQI
ncbi:MAG TPA: DUF4381 family protein [Candidatus Paceibacterota bacterium]|nr:DUF4381 family protein [Candidatus Paceibacterota bacterium]